MEEKIQELSRAEWMVMKVCWRRERATVREIHAELSAVKNWEYQTVKTMLDRLAGKGYLNRSKFGPLNVYEVVVSRSRTIQKAVENFVNVVLDNTLTPILMHFVKEKKLSEAELASLRQLIEEHDEEDTNGG